MRGTQGRRSTLSVLTESKVEIPKKSPISFYKILRNKQYYVKILPKGFRLNGKTIGFRLQI